MVESHTVQQPADHLGRARVARAAALLLAGVAEVGDDPCYPRGAGGPNGISQQCQHHQVIIHRRAGRLNDEDSRVAHVLADMHACLGVGEGPDLSGYERNLQLTGQVLGKGWVRVAGDEPHRDSGDRRRLPIVDKEDRLVGIVTLDDLLRFLGRELYNLAEGIKHEMEVK